MTTAVRTSDPITVTSVHVVLLRFATDKLHYLGCKCISSRHVFVIWRGEWALKFEGHCFQTREEWVNLKVIVDTDTWSTKYGMANDIITDNVTEKPLFKLVIPLLTWGQLRWKASKCTCFCFCVSIFVGNIYLFQHTVILMHASTVLMISGTKWDKASLLKEIPH
jgi:hypothetical protein